MADVRKPKTAKEVEKLSKQVGFHFVDKNLYLEVREGARGISARWVYRTEIDGKKRKLSLGKYTEVTIPQAKAKAIKLQGYRLEGLNPTEEVRKQRAEARERARELEAEKITLETAYMEFLEFKSGPNGWKGGESERKRAESVFRKHLRLILNEPVKTLTAEVLAGALRPAAENSPESYNKLVTKLHAFFIWCGTKGYRSIELANPADKRILKNWINPPKDEGKHYGALPPESVPKFFKLLRSKDGITARCVEFCILTGVRSKTVRLIEWTELDDDLTVWTVPPDKMKASSNGLHFVPLSKQARQLLLDIRAKGLNDKYVFPSPTGGFSSPLSENASNQFVKGLINKSEDKAFIDPVQSAIRGKAVRATMHGTSRSTLATWATDKGVDKETIEPILHHKQGKVQESYYRSKMANQRKRLLQDWADFCYSEIDKK